MAEEELSDIFLPRRHVPPGDRIPERVASRARGLAMRYTENDHPYGITDEGYISGPKEIQVYIPHRIPIDKSHACCDRLEID